MIRCAERALEGGFGKWLGGEVGKRFEHRAGAIRALGEQDRQRGFHRRKAEIQRPGVAVKAVKERRKIDELMAGSDELEVEKFRLGGHTRRIRRNRAISHHKLATTRETPRLQAAEAAHRHNNSEQCPRVAPGTAKLSPRRPYAGPRTCHPP